MVGGKRYLALTGLVMALGLAVYINWKYAPTEGFLASTENTTSTTVESVEEIGEARLVNTGTEDTQAVTASTDVKTDSSGYFAQAKLSRQTGRDEVNEVIETILESDKLSDEDKKTVVQKSIELADNIDKENKIESLVKAKGFAETLAIVSGNQVTIVVKSEGLLANEVSMIKDIIVSQAQIPAGNIKIIETK